jgi:6-pyruvoyltetrahydropterin/6-carboxytetrahydropterin synthase
MSSTRLARRKAFQCMHLYKVEQFSEAQNRKTFGACFTPHGHGHNYEMEAYFEGPVDPVTGMIVNLADVDQWLDEAVRPLVDKHLNFEVAEFREQVPTTENLAQFLKSKLQARLNGSPVHLFKLRLYESEDLWVDIWP